MDKDALLHQPQNPVSMSSCWKAQQELRAQFDKMTDDFLRGGGSIEKIQFGVVANNDNSQAAINARTWYMQHPDAAGPITGEVHITDAMLQYANKLLSTKNGGKAPTIDGIALKLGVNPISLRREVTKHRARVAAKNGAKKSNARSTKKKP